MRGCAGLTALAVLLAADVSLAQKCENPIADLAQCPGRSPMDPPYQPTVSNPPCGPEEGFKIAPQNYQIADYRPSCSVHDFCYETCNSSKTVCDTVFEQQLKLECLTKFPYPPKGTVEDPADWGHRGTCIALGRKYATAVKLFGQDAYDTAQKKACECCTCEMNDELTQAIIKAVEISGKCVGTAASDNKCSLMPSNYTSTITFAESPNRNAGAVLSKAIGPYAGSITAACIQNQPAASATKLCPGSIDPAPCNVFMGTNEGVPFGIIGELEGGVGSAARIKFKVATQHMPSACTGNVFEDLGATEDWYVPMSPTFTVGQLCSKPVKLTGTKSFTVNNVNGLIGTVECNYTVGIRPSNSAGD